MEHLALDVAGATGQEKDGTKGQGDEDEGERRGVAV
jgi:hypothetical protein